VDDKQAHQFYARGYSARLGAPAFTRPTVKDCCVPDMGKHTKHAVCARFGQLGMKVAGIILFVSLRSAGSQIIVKGSVVRNRFKPATARGFVGVPRPCQESGVTLLLVALGMFSLLAMTVISLDVIHLYISSDQAQETADAAALAGVEAIASSGTTSAPSLVLFSSVCNNSNADADQRAQVVAAKNTIAGLSPTTVTTSCVGTLGTNPRMQVTVTRTGVPTFFAGIWGAKAIDVSATALAEAYNPSFDPANPQPTRPPIEIRGVKPWLISNCNLCPNGPLFFASNYSIANGAGFLGQVLTLKLITSSTSPSPQPLNGGVAEFYALDGPAAVSCPSVAGGCSQIGTGRSGLNYHDNIACQNGVNFGNGQFVGSGQTFSVDTRSAGNLQARTTPGTECLIHASSTGTGQGQDIFSVGLRSPVKTFPASGSSTGVAREADWVSMERRA
jgi:Putative Flp pilus-assembly TadE/G-like